MIGVYWGQNLQMSETTAQGAFGFNSS